MAERRRPGRYPAAVRERACGWCGRRDEHDSLWVAICSVSENCGMTAESQIAGPV